MTYKIAHISDIHWESSDHGTSAALGTVLAKEKPDLLICTGDLVDNFYHLKEAKQWLLELCSKCGIDPEENLLIVPGNHDYRLWGNLGILPITGAMFRRYFKAWRQKPVRMIRVSKNLSLTFLHIDSNPVIWGLARGKVGWWEMRKVRRALQALPDESQNSMMKSLKFALLHHHPLPIPYGGGDNFLFLKDSNRLLQFLAENKVDMVLHGHKHSAPYSLLSMGGCASNGRVLEVLGAGTAVKSTDMDPRGHNFNLICIEPDGLRYVRQFFARPQEDFAESLEFGYPEQSFMLAHQHACLTRGLRFQSIHWDMRIDAEGDRFNEIAYAGFAVNAGKDFKSLRLPAYVVETGHLSDVWLNKEKSAPGIVIERDKKASGPRHVEFEVRFPNRPTVEQPSRFAVQSWDLNACSLNLADFKKKFPGREEEREWEQKRIDCAVEDFHWMIQFPRELEFRTPPEFEVVDTTTHRRHDWLTRILQRNFRYSPQLHTVALSIHRPPHGFLYRIYWYPGPEPKNIQASAPFKSIGRVAAFTRDLLELSKKRRSGHGIPDKLARIDGVLEALARLVAEKTKATSGVGYVQPEDFDVSFMADDGKQASRSPKLQVVSASGDKQDAFWDFTLEEGDGNAGRAYKKNAMRCYDSKIPDHGKDIYITVPGFPKHEILYSMPLRDADHNDLLYGILNLGSFDERSADALRLLNNEEGHQWLLEAAHKYFLPRLLDIIFEEKIEQEPRRKFHVKLGEKFALSGTVARDFRISVESGDYKENDIYKLGKAKELGPALLGDKTR